MIDLIAEHEQSSKGLLLLVVLAPFLTLARAGFSGPRTYRSDRRSLTRLSELKAELSAQADDRRKQTTRRNSERGDNTPRRTNEHCAESPFIQFTRPFFLADVQKVETVMFCAASLPAAYVRYTHVYTYSHTYVHYYTLADTRTDGIHTHTHTVTEKSAYPTDKGAAAMVLLHMSRLERYLKSQAECSTTTADSPSSVRSLHYHQPPHHYYGACMSLLLASLPSLASASERGESGYEPAC